MSRSNFRVKVDLSNFYNDARRFCWVFVDGTKILHIHHIKQHITKLFDIKEPFHLLLNDAEYLPPTEDVRILKESETIAVIPGSGLNNEQEPASTTRTSNKSRNDHNTDRLNYIQHCEPPAIHTTKSEMINSDQAMLSEDMVHATQQDTSSIDITFHSILEDTEADSATESKATDSNVTEDCSTIEQLPPLTARKRIRKRKPKKQTSLLITNINEKECRSKKPKIIDSFIISSGKHIRFDTVEEDESTGKQILHEVALNDSYPHKTSVTKDLSALLALRQSSTPLTFISKKAKKEVKLEIPSDDEASVASPCETPRDVKKEQLHDEKLLDTDIERRAPMTSRAKLHDVIAFKMLKIGADYTPQVSDFIVGEVVNCNQENSVYTIKIIRGIDQVQVPVGKFTLPQDETELVIHDTVNLNCAQIIEPRLLCNSN